MLKIKTDWLVPIIGFLVMLGMLVYPESWGRILTIEWLVPVIGFLVMLGAFIYAYGWWKGILVLLGGISAIMIFFYLGMKMLDIVDRYPYLVIYGFGIIALACLTRLIQMRRIKSC